MGEKILSITPSVERNEAASQNLVIGGISAKKVSRDCAMLDVVDANSFQRNGRHFLHKLGGTVRLYLKIRIANQWSIDRRLLEGAVNGNQTEQEILPGAGGCPSRISSEKRHRLVINMVVFPTGHLVWFIEVS